MKEMIVTINNEGTVSGLHFDEFDLGFLGRKEVKRASEIVFDFDSQSWDIHLPDYFGPVCESVCGFNGYDIARAFEVEWLQTCMQEECAPGSERGKQVAKILRTTGAEYQ